MKQFKKLRLFLSISYQLSPSYFYVLVIGSLFQSFQVFGNVVFPKFLIDELMGLQRIDYLVMWGGAIVTSNLLFGFLTKLYRRMLEVKQEFIRQRMQSRLAEKIMDVDFHYLEDPYYLDLKERALFATNNQDVLGQMVNALARILTSIVTLIGLVTILLMLSPIVILILAAGIIITFVINLTYRSFQNRFYSNLIPINRKYNYYMNLSSELKISKDVRLYQMNPMLTGKVKSYNDEIMKELDRFFRRDGLTTAFIRVIQAIQSGIVYLYIAVRVFTTQWGPKISLGSFSMYVSGAIQFSVAMDAMLNHLVTIRQMLRYLDPFMEFMTLPVPEETGKKLPFQGEFNTIRFENVFFHYQNSEQMILKDISFTMEKGEKISIVGLNGAGKTTLIKLLCRLYQPTAGIIYVNDVNIQDYDYQSYRDAISVVFQDYRLFEYSILENITGEGETKDDKLHPIIQQVGLKDVIDGLPKGIHSTLNKSLDLEGVELSGGQQQKIAIARALYKNSNLVILDEPTSALDPIAEAEIYEHFNQLVQDKTAIYISHRMSSSVFCDRVLIIDGGKIADYDTHLHLMKKKDSLYYKLFTSQAEHYKL